MKALPISPVGPVTATVSMRRFWRNGTTSDWLAVLTTDRSGVDVDDLNQLLETA
jgi:hypothetical protein